jgi:beta-mannosidase
MFACHLYPTNPQFLASVRDEVRYQIRRLQHHPSIALWCGNNENEMAVSWHTSGDRERLKTLLIAEYDQLYIQTIAPIVAEEDPDRVYWPSSPSNGIRKYEDPNDMSRGDVHFWDVWHGDKPYEHYETVIPRFCSEFGFQSFPAPETMALCTDPSDRNLTSPVAEFHQRSGQGNQRILKHISIHFRMPYTWEDTLYMSQVHQAEAIRVAVEHWRRNKPRNMGVIVWQLNDIWPVASWASLDSTGRWKLLQYLEKRAFAPLMVSAGFKEGKASVWGVSDINSPVSGTLTIRLRSVSTGKTLKTLTRKVALKPLESRKIYSFEPGTLLKSVPEWTGEVCAELSLVCGKSISRNVLFFDEYKRLNLQDPGLKWSLDKKGCLTVSCRRPALFVTANTGAANGSWEDNGVHLFPGQSLKVRFRSWPRDDRKALTALRKGLKLTDLWTATTDQKAR